MTDFSKDAKIFKALCDTKRLTILDYLKSGEKCACVLIENMNIGQSALSYHMKILCDSGIVHARQDTSCTLPQPVPAAYVLPDLQRQTGFPAY